MICALLQSHKVQLELPVSITLFEMQAKLLVFEQDADKLVGSRVIIYTHSEIGFNKLWSQRWQGILIQQWREILFIIAATNILVEPK